MKTRDVDLAAYLHLSGLEPRQVEVDTQAYLVFHYVDSEYLRHCVDSFQGDAVVPVRAFCEARKHVKKLATRCTGHHVKSRREQLHETLLAEDRRRKP